MPNKKKPEDPTRSNLQALDALIESKAKLKSIKNWEELLYLIQSNFGTLMPNASCIIYGDVGSKYITTIGTTARPDVQAMALFLRALHELKPHVLSAQTTVISDEMAKKLLFQLDITMI